MCGKRWGLPNFVDILSVISKLISKNIKIIYIKISFKEYILISKLFVLICNIFILRYNIL